MMHTLNRRLFGTPLDGPDGSLGARKLAVVVAVLLLVGGTAIFVGQRYIATNDTWPATVVGVARTTVNIHFDVGSDEVELASYPKGMVLAEGDRVLVHVDVEYVAACTGTRRRERGDVGAWTRSRSIRTLTVCTMVTPTPA